ncbi:uncharacterized protein CTRU02_213896 [Colletotrichum truncatum]|uniref:Uncharacterized protein n=1 Tax=Colletotrichum truncatum TaxID=5467 RepID=A0ACC3YHM2_COLTU|nr:uncharacterized protein CTRU02_06210 [Colletotrichum truncatum]KAF6792714.1 hypothetical protein CTRU02_06210 [Colletotrichum truncatum]
MKEFNSMSPACDICSRILNVFVRGDGQDRFDGLDILLSDTSCEGHSGFIDFIRGDLVNGEVQTTATGVLSMHREHPAFVDVRASGSSERFGQPHNHMGWLMTLLQDETLLNHPGRGLPLDPKWVNLDLARQWKARCHSHHGSECDNPFLVAPAVPAWLIDTTTNCLVPGTSELPYVALSYRWGSFNDFKTHQGDLSKLQERGSFVDPEVSASLSPIVRHAMHLTRNMDERYLWVDAICITQDDPEQISAHLVMMAAIYATAVFTIVGADGDSRSGLIGVPDTSESRDIEQKVIPFAGNHQIALSRSTTGVSAMLSSSPYSERGWTFQEYMMSKRRLVFRNKQLTWECQKDVWYEDVSLPAVGSDDSPNFLAAPIRSILSGYPDLASLNTIIGKYNKRQFTFEEDALPGISGLLAILSRTFEGGFLYGLPVMFFDAALAWNRSPFGIGNLQRRIDSGHAHHKVSSSRLPSWSWIGWRGEVGINWHQEGFSYWHRNKETIPITNWFASEKPHSGPKLHIKPTWFSRRDMYKHMNPTLSEGWTANVSGTKATSPYAPHDYMFTYGDWEQKFNYPIPIAKVTEASPYVTPPQSPFISCSTKRSWLRAKRYRPGIVQTGGLKYEVHRVTLHNALGSQIGYMTLQSNKDSDLISEDSKGTLIELVAISREIEIGAHGHDETKDFYLVLWVSWVDSIAYRKGCGRVQKDAWERLDLQDVELVLG